MFKPSSFNMSNSKSFNFGGISSAHMNFGLQQKKFLIWFGKTYCFSFRFFILMLHSIELIPDNKINNNVMFFKCAMYVRNVKIWKRESLSCTETGILTLIKLWGWEDWQSCLPLSNTWIISGHRQPLPLQLNSTYLWPGKYFLFLCLPRDMTSNEPQKKREQKKAMKGRLQAEFQAWGDFSCEATEGLVTCRWPVIITEYIGSCPAEGKVAGNDSRLHTHIYYTGIEW